MVWRVAVRLGLSMVIVFACDYAALSTTTTTTTTEDAQHLVEPSLLIATARNDWLGL